MIAFFFYQLGGMLKTARNYILQCSLGLSGDPLQTIKELNDLGGAKSWFIGGCCAIQQRLAWLFAGHYPIKLVKAN